MWHMYTSRSAAAIAASHACLKFAFHCTHAAVCRYSIAVLVVEAIGVSALVPYAFANLKPTLPEEEHSNHDPEQPRSYATFGPRER
jgi:hypothetical protein